MSAPAPDPLAQLRSAGTEAAGGSAPSGSLLGRPVTQVAMVVPDLDAAMTTWWQGLGVGPWHVYTLGRPTMTGMSYRGRPAPFRIRLGLAFSGGMMLELIEPLEGPSIWQESLDRAGGSAFQHVAIYVDDYAAAGRTMADHGWRPVQTGEGFGRSAMGR